MKRWITFLFAAAFTFALAGCGDQGAQESGTGETSPLREESAQPLTSPPALTATCGDQSVEALLGTYSWQYDNGDGTMMAVEACGGHPLDYLNRMTPISRGESESAVLHFAAEPASVSVRCWSDQYAGEEGRYEESGAALKCGDGTVELLTDGGYVYEVTAEWECGNAHYSFYIVD